MKKKDINKKISNAKPSNPIETLTIICESDGDLSISNLLQNATPTGCLSKNQRSYNIESSQCTGIINFPSLTVTFDGKVSGQFGTFEIAFNQQNSTIKSTNAANISASITYNPEVMTYTLYIAPPLLNFVSNIDNSIYVTSNITEPFYENLFQIQKNTSNLTLINDNSFTLNAGVFEAGINQMAILSPFVIQLESSIKTIPYTIDLLNQTKTTYTNSEYQIIEFTVSNPTQNNATDYQIQNIEYNVTVNNQIPTFEIINNLNSSISMKLNEFTSNRILATEPANCAVFSSQDNSYTFQPGTCSVALETYLSSSLLVTTSNGEVIFNLDNSNSTTNCEFCSLEYDDTNTLYTITFN